MPDKCINSHAVLLHITVQRDHLTDESTLNFLALFNFPNVVGYATQNTEAKAYKTMGSMFISVGSTTKTWKLGDIKMDCNGNDGGAYGANFIQFIDPATSVIDTEKIYNYYGVEDGAIVGEDDGWYTVNDNDEKHDLYSNDIEFPSGTAFLCNFDPSYNAKLTYSGQVLVGDVVIDTVIDGSSKAYLYVVNPIPVVLTLGDIKMACNGNDGGAYGSNFIQFIDPATSVIDTEKIYNYYGVEDGAIAGENDGWYTVNDNDEKHDLYSNDVEFGVGDGFLCNFDPSYNAKLIFSNPLK